MRRNNNVTFITLGLNCTDGSVCLAGRYLCGCMYVRVWRPRTTMKSPPEAWRAAAATDTRNKSWSWCPGSDLKKVGMMRVRLPAEPWLVGGWQSGSHPTFLSCLLAEVWGKKEINPVFSWSLLRSYAGLMIRWGSPRWACQRSKKRLFGAMCAPGSLSSENVLPEEGGQQQAVPLLAIPGVSISFLVQRRK